MTDREIVQSRFGEVWQVCHPEYKVTCPGCGKKALWVNVDKECYHCFVCGLGGSTREMSGKAGAEARLAFLLGVADNGVRPRGLPTASDRLVLPPRYRRVNERAQAPDAWDYVQSRGVNPELVEFGVHEPLSVTFPMYEESKVVYWQSRSIVPNLRRKTGNPGKKRLGYGKDAVVYRLDTVVKGHPAIIVEGVFDALRSGGVATLGKTMSNQQAMKIFSRKPSAVFICYDGDAFDYSLQAARSMFLLSRQCPVIPVRLPGELDPADLGRQRLLNLIKAVVHDLEPPELAHLMLLGVSAESLLTQLRDSPSVW